MDSGRLAVVMGQMLIFTIVQHLQVAYEQKLKAIPVGTFSQSDLPLRLSAAKARIQWAPSQQSVGS